MSGPKVVRVVTREERLATCVQLLASLDVALARWKEQARQLGVQDAVQAEAAHEAKRSALRFLLAEDRFDELGAAIPAEISFLVTETERLRVASVGAYAERLQRGRTQRDNARALIKDLANSEAQDHSIGAQLHLVADGIVSGSEGDAILGAAMRVLSPKLEPSELTDAQRALASRLRDPDADAAETPTAHEFAGSTRLENVERRLAELESWGAPTDEFAARLRALEHEAGVPHAQMRIDSLVLEVAEAARAAASLQAARDTASDVLAQMRAVVRQPSSNDWRAAGAALESALAGTNRELLAEATLAARSLLGDQHTLNAAAARRGAVLAGLAALGYEVREGMTTSWATQGRLVLRKPALPDYGVEVASPADAQRLQVRAVAFDESRNTARDRDVEALWCTDFSKLQASLAGEGISLQVERALPVGAVPLKCLARADADVAANLGQPIERTHT